MKLTHWRTMRTMGLCLLAVWWAVAPVRVVAAPGSDPTAAAIAWLHTQQNTDGGFGYGGESVPAATAEVVYVLALYGENPAGPAWTVNGHSALDALANLAPLYVTDAGQVGRIARAVALAGANPRNFAGMDLIGLIQQAYDPITGRYEPDLLYNHSLAVEALLRAGVAVPPGAVNALFSAQLPDGSWFWSFNGSQGDVDTTGRVMHLLAGHAHLLCTASYTRAASYLANAVIDGGGWGVLPPSPPPTTTNPSNANSTALAVAGLLAAGFDPDGPAYQRSGVGGRQSLLAFQEASGAFRYMTQAGREENRLIATTDALIGLAQPLAVTTCRPVYLPMLLR